MDAKIIPLTVVAMVLLAGCTSPASPARSTASELTTTATDALTRTDAATETPTAEATDSTESTTIERYPPGISEDGLHNVTALVSNHTSTLASTGFVANGSLDTTVERSGFLIDVSANGKTRVEENFSTYLENRTTEGGPTTREREIWSDGEVEYRRTEEDGSVEYEEREARNRKAVAGRTVMGPFLRGGEYELGREFGSGDGKRFVLNATTYNHEDALMRGLPKAATAVRSYNSTVIVDREGRIRKFDARIGFVIDGENRSHRVHYDIAQIGEVTVERPDWVDEVASETIALAAGVGPGETAQRAVQPSDSQQAWWTLDGFDGRASWARPAELAR